MTTVMERPRQMSAGLVFRTGAGGIDAKLGSGIPAGSLTLVEGQSDSGKSVLLQHFSYNAASQGTKVVYYTTENTIKSTLRQMESLGLDIVDAFLLDDFHVYPVDASRADSGAQQLSEALLDHMAALPDDVSLVIVDSITNILNQLAGSYVDEGGNVIIPNRGRAIVQFFERCKELCDQGKTICLAAHTHAIDEETFTRVRSVCHAHFRLKVNQVGERLVKTLEVAKIHRAELATGNIITFDVEPGLGIRMSAISTAKS